MPIIINKSLPQCIYQEVKFDSAHDLIEWLNWGPLSKRLPGGSYIFRGEDRFNYSLIPSSLREASEAILKRTSVFKSDKDNKKDLYQMKAEYILLKRFFDLCDKNGLDLPDVENIREQITNTFDDALDQFGNIKWIPRELWEIAGLAQHYGLPTRLIDWTYDYNIALYFASQNFLTGGKWRSIWALFTLPFKANETPLAFIRPPYSRNTNLSAQKGLFTLWQSDINYSSTIDIDKIPLEEKISKYYSDSPFLKKYMERYDQLKILYRLIFYSLDIFEITKYLQNIGINASTIFPSMEGIANYIKNSSMPISSL